MDLSLLRRLLWQTLLSSYFMVGDGGDAVNVVLGNVVVVNKHPFVCNVVVGEGFRLLLWRRRQSRRGHRIRRCRQWRR